MSVLVLKGVVGDYLVRDGLLAATRGGEPLGWLARVQRRFATGGIGWGRRVGSWQRLMQVQIHYETWFKMLRFNGLKLEI